MDERTALRVLGLAGPAAPEDVKAAYRRLARDQHPDAGGDVGAFQDLQAAYEVLRGGTDTTLGGPGPQERAPSVDARWWEAPGAWHEGAVARDGVDAHVEVPDRRSVRAGPDLVAALVLGGGTGWELVSRAPGSWLNRVVGMLDPDLTASLTVAPATSGPRTGHDVVAQLRAPGGRGRRTAAEASLPNGWIRDRASEAVRLERRLRPSRDPQDTAVRAARAVDDLCEALRWPLSQWALVRDAAG